MLHSSRGISASFNFLRKRLIITSRLALVPRSAPGSAIYRVVLEPTDPVAINELPELRGQLVIQGTPEAWSAGYYRSFMALVQRESGF